MNRHHQLISSFHMKSRKFMIVDFKLFIQCSTHALIHSVQALFQHLFLSVIIYHFLFYFGRHLSPVSCFAFFAFLLSSLVPQLCSHPIIPWCVFTAYFLCSFYPPINLPSFAPCSVLSLDFAVYVSLFGLLDYCMMTFCI